MTNQLSMSIGSDLADIRSAAAELGRVSNVVKASVPDAASGSGSFATSMVDALRDVNEQDRTANRKMADVDGGRSDDLVGAMLASQQASLSFSMLMQVRNKVMGAVEDLVKLPL